MSDHFLIHQSHRYEEEARREEACFFNRVYETVCLSLIFRGNTTENCTQTSRKKRVYGTPSILFLQLSALLIASSQISVLFSCYWDAAIYTGIECERGVPEVKERG